MKKSLALLIILTIATNVFCQIDVHGGYALVLERAISRKTTIMMHGGYLETGYNFKLVENLGIRPAINFQMSQMTQNSVSALQTSEARKVATIVNRSNKEFDIQIPAYLNYSFDPTMKLHFNVFIGPSLGLTINGLKAVEFRDVNYANAVKNNNCSVNLALGMGFEFRFQQFGMRIAFNREMVSSGHKTKYIRRDILQVGVSYRFGEAKDKSKENK